MKYPGLPAAGTDGNPPEGSWDSGIDSAAVDAWRRLGGPLPDAVATIEPIVLDTTPDSSTVARAVALAEGRRRIEGNAVAALAAHQAVNVAERLGDDVLVAAARLVASTRAWTVADLNEAAKWLAAARDVAVAGSEASAHCDLAEARLLRISNAVPQARLLAERAQDTLASADPDGLADAERELAALSLLVERTEEARSASDAALAQHRRRGDRYLSTQASVLLARCIRGSAPLEAADVLRGAVAEAHALGSPDLEVVALTHLGQLLQTVVSDRPELSAEAFASLERALSIANDPFTEAELLSARASLRLRVFELDGVEADLAAAARGYQEISNPLGLARVAHLRARWRWLTVGGRPGRSLLLRREALQDVTEAATWYAAAHAPGAERSLRLEQMISDALLGSGPLDPDELGRILALRDDDAAGSRERARADLLRAFEVLGSATSRTTRRRARTEARRARKLLEKTLERLSAMPDHQLVALTTIGLAQAHLIEGDAAQGMGLLRNALEELARFDTGLADPRRRAGFIDAVEPLTRRLLSLAIDLKDPHTGLRLLEYRRTGRLAGLLRRRAEVRLSPAVSDVLDRMDAARSRGQRGDDDRNARDTSSVMADLNHVHADLERRTSSLFAETYDPAGIDVDELVASVPPDAVVLLLDRPEQASPDVLVRAVVAPRSPDVITIDRVVLPTSALELLDVLTSTAPVDRRRQHRLRSLDIASLSEPLLGPLLPLLRHGGGPRDLLVVPSGQLWAVPFPGLPVLDPEGHVLLERTSVTLTPSLRFHELLSRRGSSRRTGALSWRHPELDLGVGGTGDNGHDEARGLDVLGDAHRRADSSKDVVSALLDDHGRLDVLAIAAHGIPDPGLAHGIELDPATILRTADLIAAEMPRLLLLGACVAAFSPGLRPGEPIGLPTVALCSGAEAVVCPSLDLSNEPEAADYLARLYATLVTHDHPGRAHAAATRAWLADDPTRRLLPLSTWACVEVIGSLPRPDRRSA